MIWLFDKNSWYLGLIKRFWYLSLRAQASSILHYFLIGAIEILHVKNCTTVIPMKYTSLLLHSIFHQVSRTERERERLHTQSTLEGKRNRISLFNNETSVFKNVNFILLNWYKSICTSMTVPSKGWKRYYLWIKPPAQWR